MSEAEEKAKELVDRFYALITRLGDFANNWEQAKQCALICVDEMIYDLTKKNYYPDGKNCYFDPNYHRCNWWREVKQEIESYER